MKIEFGKPHPSVQQVDCNYVDYDSLMALIPSRVNQLKKGRNGNGIVVADDAATWFRNDNHVAFYSPPSTCASHTPLSYAQLQKEIQTFATYKTSSSTTHVVAVLLPPSLMAETAVILVTLLAQKGICVAPMDPNMSIVKVLAALEQLQCSALVITKALFKALPEEAMTTLQDIRFVEPSVKGHQLGVVDWTIVKQDQLKEAQFDLPPDASPGLLLRTSGTTSTPKMVPITRKALLYNATCLAVSLQLAPNKDVGCNAMPLFHIGGISCGLLAVLISGSSVVMMPGPFDSQAFMDAIAHPTNADGNYAQPTWYYGVPSMHKALLLTAKARQKHSSCPINCQLRFIRSGAAHLPHATAVELAGVFRTEVYPTYSMSECMPVCSCHDAPVEAAQQAKPSIAETTPTQARNKEGSIEVVDATLATFMEVEEIVRDGVPDDTVGMPIGCSMAIVDQEDSVLPYGLIGQVVLKGPGVVKAYIGITNTQSHTAQGWFKTGDMGQLDANGRLVLSGRLKEMIKRGGDQVWPNEVDGVVESVPGVRLAVTFGVENELWGEEVQVAVVLNEEAKSTTVDKDALERAIVQACLDQLGSTSAPSKVHYVESPDNLPKGSTGKFLRTKMAGHLGAMPVDTGALNALEVMAAMSQPASTLEESTQAKKATPSNALNGVRFLAACFVVQHHVGFMPNSAWLKIQTFSLNMSIFFMLGAFQLTASIKNEVKSSSAHFIGTKLGSMHALFVVSQFIALGSYLLFQCGANGYAKIFDGKSCTEEFPFLFPTFILNTLTGLGGFVDPVNGPAWFQSAFYLFLIVFPLLDWHLRSCSNCYLTFIFWLNMFIASVGIAALFAAGGTGLNFLFPSWLPALVTAMIAAYWFSNNASLEDGLSRPGIFQRPRLWGLIADVVSIVFILFEVAVSLSGGCVSILLQNYQEARPGQPLPEGQFEHDGLWYGTVCNLTYEEFELYVHDEPDDLNNGRWTTIFGGVVGFFRLGTPLVLLWLFGLAYGRGITATIMETRLMQIMAEFGYPMYLLHVPVARVYWVATRGHEAEFWWPTASLYPIPVQWFELFFIIAICIALAVPLDRFVVQHLSPYTIGWGVTICQVLARKCCCCCSSGSAITSPGEGQASTLQQVAQMVQGLTGNADVGRSTCLRDLGLDSLGATALLGTLRCAVPDARSLTLSELSKCGTVGDLVDLLETSHVPAETNKKEEAPPV